MTDSNNSPNDPKDKAFQLQRWIGLVVFAFLLSWVFLIHKKGPQSLSESPSDQQAHFNTNSPPSPVRPLEFPTKSGVFQLKAHRGQPIIMAFWAYWCEPCLKDLPQLLGIYENQPNFKIITVNIDHDAALQVRAKKLLKPFSNNSNLVHLFPDDDGRRAVIEFLEQYDSAQVPYHLMLDKDMNVKWHGYGELNWSSPKVQQMVQESI